MPAALHAAVAQTTVKRSVPVPHPAKCEFERCDKRATNRGLCPPCQEEQQGSAATPHSVPSRVTKDPCRFDGCPNLAQRRLLRRPRRPVLRRPPVGPLFKPKTGRDFPAGGSVTALTAIAREDEMYDKRLLRRFEREKAGTEEVTSSSSNRRIPTPQTGYVAEHTKHKARPPLERFQEVRHKNGNRSSIITGHAVGIGARLPGLDHWNDTPSWWSRTRRPSWLMSSTTPRRLAMSASLLKSKSQTAIVVWAAQATCLTARTLGEGEARRPTAGIARIQRVEPVQVEAVPHVADRSWGEVQSPREAARPYLSRQQHTSAPPPGDPRAGAASDDAQQPVALLAITSRTPTRSATRPPRRPPRRHESPSRGANQVISIDPPRNDAGTALGWSHQPHAKERARERQTWLAVTVVLTPP